MKGGEKMSQSVMNLLAGNTTGALWYGVSGKATTDQTAVQSFDQTLLSMLAGNTKTQEGTMMNPLLSLVGLTEMGENPELSAEEQSLSALIDTLLQQLQQLDEVLQTSDELSTENSDLLAALQGWLQNVSQLLQSDTTSESGLEASVSNTELPDLAQHSSTMKFAIQDALLQLIPASKNEQSTNVVRVDVEQIKTVLESLNSVLNAAGITGDLKAINTLKSLLDSSLLSTKDILANGQQGSQISQVEQTDEESQIRLVQKTDVISTVPASSNTNASLLSDQDQSTGNDDNFPLQTGNIVTAGQLAMRDASAVPMKPVQVPTVPVEKFGQEMSSFLVGKFDIVNANGISEAKISLFPEHLGQVDVRITMQNGLLTAQFMTEHAFAKESLEAQMAQLRLALQSQGLQVSKLEVTQNTALSSHLYQDGRQSGNGSSQQQNGKRRDLIRDEDLMLINDISDEWNEWIAEIRSKEDSLGSSFTARV